MRGKTNAYSVALVLGIMTAEQEESVRTRVEKAIANDKAIIAIKKKARKDALETAVVAKLVVVEPVMETEVVA